MAGSTRWRGRPARRFWSLQSRQRRLAGWFPDRRIAANGGQRAVPRPDRDRKIESSNDADDTQRMPLLHHPVLRPLRSDGQPVKLSRKPDRKIADIDHLLHFALAFGDDFAASSVTSAAQVFLGGAKRCRSCAINFAALRGGHSCAMF